MTSNEWKSRGNFLQVNNNRLFVIDTNNDSNNDSNKSQKSMVVLHGYPTSSLDYYKVLPELSKSYRVILHDHLGFGFSDKPKNVVFTNGIFDVLHSGHIELLKFSKSLGDKLIVGLNSDSSVKQIKGSEFKKRQAEFEYIVWFKMRYVRKISEYIPNNISFKKGI